jgi:outer membrane protein assembly factor BamE
MQMRAVRLSLLAIALSCLWACSFPGVYKLEVQQGNIVTQESVDQLKPGMSKRQVRYLLGTPLLIDSFNENRWDYFFSQKNRHAEYSQERLTLFFVSDQLHHLQGNFKPSAAAKAQALPVTPAPAPAAVVKPADVYPVETPPVIKAQTR